MLQHIFFQRAFIIFQSAFIFFQSAFIFFSDTCVIFLRLFHGAFISFHSAFISFHSAFIWQRAFVQVFLSAGKRFIIALSLNFFWMQVSAYFLFFKVWNSVQFCFQKHHSASALVSGCGAHNFLIMLWLFLIFLYVLISALIMFKTSRFWPLV